MNTVSVPKTLTNTVLKMSIGFEYPTDVSVTLDTIDFFVEYFCNSSKRVTLQKDELHREELNGIVTFYAYVDTAITGKGNLKMRLCADIPDVDAPGGIRKEYVEVDTDVVIY